MMTTDQEHLITLIFVKYGDLKAVVDAWLYNDPALSSEELSAIDAWLSETQSPSPVTLVDEGDFRYLSCEITVTMPGKDRPPE